VPHDFPRAAKLYKQGCDGNEALGCYNLGLMYAQGRGVIVRDERQALGWLVEVEVTYASFGERGAIDILAGGQPVGSPS
jgi:hypothetical protein